MAESTYKDSLDVKSAAKTDTTKADTAVAVIPGLEILYKTESNPMI